MPENTELMCTFYDEVYNCRNVAFLREHLHPNVVGRGPGVEDLVRGVVGRGTVTAKHRPTGSPVSFVGMTMYRLGDGLMRDYWCCYDRHDLYDRQLGGWRAES